MKPNFPPHLDRPSSTRRIPRVDESFDRWDDEIMLYMSLPSVSKGNSDARSPTFGGPWIRADPDVK